MPDPQLWSAQVWHLLPFIQEQTRFYAKIFHLHRAGVSFSRQSADPTNPNSLPNRLLPTTCLQTLTLHFLLPRRSKRTWKLSNAPNESQEATSIKTRTAQEIAETAKTKAQIAQRSTEALKNQAEVAKLSAQRSQQAIEGVKTKAQTDYQTIQTAKTQAETAKRSTQQTQQAAEAINTNIQATYSTLEATKTATKTAAMETETAKVNAQEAYRATENVRRQAEVANQQAQQAQQAAEIARKRAEQAQKQVETILRSNGISPVIRDHPTNTPTHPINPRVLSAFLQTHKVKLLLGTIALIPLLLLLSKALSPRPVLSSIYVNPVTGNDSNNGTATTPFRTLPHALQRAGAGSSIYLARGDYSTDRSLTIPANTKLVIPPFSFNDIKGHWAAPFIRALATQGLIAGYPDGLSP